MTLGQLKEKDPKLFKEAYELSVKQAMAYGTIEEAEKYVNEELMDEILACCFAFSDSKRGIDFWWNLNDK